MMIEVTTGGWASLDVQALAVPVFKDEQPDAGVLGELDTLTGGMLRAVIESGELTGKEGETALVHFNTTQRDAGGVRATRLLLIGVGAQEDYRVPQIAQAAGAAARLLRGKNFKTIGFAPRGEGNASAAVTASVEGAQTALFDADKYRTVEREERNVERFVVVASGDEVELNKAAERGRIIGEGINFARDLANEPGAHMTPTILSERARELSEKFGLEIDVLDEDRMRELGMGALLCVGQGSEEPSKLIVLKYTPEGYTPPANASGEDGDGSNKGELLAFVGKGITFDTGGISIKPAENMEAMKYDMSGGAAVLGAMRAVAQLKPSVPVLGIVPSAENMPSGKAVKPGDVVRAMTGKTIEVINTDAEGRLVLADALAYAKQLGATRVVDLATLTGAVVVALGDVNVAVMGTDQSLIDEIITSGREVGEKHWQLPLDPEYTKQIKSDIADIKNIGGRKAGTITAAAFLKEFADGFAWAHLDIAGTAWADDAKPYRAKGPTGVGVRTLLKLVENQAARSSSSQS